MLIDARVHMTVMPVAAETCIESESKQLRVVHLNCDASCNQQEQLRLALKASLSN